MKASAPARPHSTPPLPALVELYLARCRVEGKSPRTVQAYRETLGRFLRALAEEGAPLRAERVGPDAVVAYLGHFLHLSHETRHRYFREVRCFFNWLRAAGYVEHDPFRGLRNVRLPQKIVQPYSADEVAVLLAHCDPTTPIGLRDRAILLTLLDTGLRRSELVCLQRTDLDLDGRRLRVLHGKGNKQRVAPFASQCEEALRAYLVARGDRAGPLIVASNGHGQLLPDVPLGSNGLLHLLQRLGKRAGVAKVHAHRFRHTFATWAIQHDARELDVQYLLGHASPDMVRRYSAAYGSEQAALRHVRFSPADQMIGAAVGG